MIARSPTFPERDRFMDPINRIFVNLYLCGTLHNVTDSSNEWRNNQGDDDSLQHLKEQITDELHIHCVSLAPGLLRLLQCKSKADAWEEMMILVLVMSMKLYLPNRTPTKVPMVRALSLRKPEHFPFLSSAMMLLDFPQWVRFYCCEISEKIQLRVRKDCGKELI